jgi:Na+-translocating ferredoxin:NAD+ oxidoreductase RNF subunit RnfB
VASGKAAYEELAKRICYGVAYPSYLKVLAIQMTPRQAEMIVDLADGKTTAQLTQKFKIDESTLTGQVNALIAGRFIQRSPTGGYNIPLTPRFFPHGSGPEANTLFTATFRDGSYPKALIEGWKRRMAMGAPQSHKIIPAHQALKASPNLKAKDILWYEDIEQIFEHSSKVTQGGWKADGTLGGKQESGCGCRAVWDDACDRTGGCTGWVWKPGVWETVEIPGQLQAGAEARQARAGAGRERPSLTKEQAMKAIYEMEDNGQVKISPNSARITGTCNCCPDCCVIIWPMKNYGNIYEQLAPSRFRAVIDEKLCDGCQTCVERCHFDAVELRKVPGSKKMKSFIIDAHCMGCGNCIYKCPQKAMHLEIVRPPEHIPTVPRIDASTLEGQRANAALARERATKAAEAKAAKPQI